MKSSKLCLSKFRNMYEIDLKARYKDNPTKELKERMIFRGLI